MDRLYIIGAGVIARAHAAAARKLPGGQEIHVTDPSEAAIATFLSETPEAIVHPDPAAMLAGPSRPSDLVIVATPPVSHASLAIQAFATGRHVLSEKPLAMTLGEAQSMREAARKAGRHLFDCSVRFMGDPAGKDLRAVIAEGSLGTLYHVTCRHIASRARSGIEYQPATRWFLDRSKSGGGVLLDWGVYDLATLFEVLSPTVVDVVHAWTAQPATDADPAGVVFDVETHLGATLVAFADDGRKMVIDYERASGTHAEDKLDMQIEGTLGSVSWKWIPFPVETTELRLRKDAGGQIVETRQTYQTADTVHFHARPVVVARQAIAGQANGALADDRALFNFGVIQAIYAVAAGAGPMRITL
jgi:predicted dehydrogenase